MLINISVYIRLYELRQTKNTNSTVADQENVEKTFDTYVQFVGAEVCHPDE